MKNLASLTIYNLLNFDKKTFLKKILVFMAIFVIVGSFLKPNIVVIAENEDIKLNELQEELSSTIDEQLSNLDFAEIESILKSLNDNENKVFGASDFSSKVKSIVSGEFASGQTSIFSAIINLVFDDVLAFIPLLASIIVVSIICGFLSNLRSENNNKSVGDIIHFVCYGIVISLVMTAVVSLLRTTTATLSSLQGQMKVVFQFC